MKIRYVFGVFGLAAALTACDQTQSAIDQASSAKDKATVCAQALGLANLNPTIDPAKLEAEAGQKAEELQKLASQVADQDLKQNLSTLADSYIAIEQKQVGNLSDWIQRNTANLNNLRQACL
jgi:hypothetical protein